MKKKKTWKEKNPEKYKLELIQTVEKIACCGIYDRLLPGGPILLAVLGWMEVNLYYNVILQKIRE